jgi:hypothetical protein
MRPENTREPQTKKKKENRVICFENKKKKEKNTWGCLKDFFIFYLTRVVDNCIRHGPNIALTCISITLKLFDKLSFFSQPPPLDVGDEMTFGFKKDKSTPPPPFSRDMRGHQVIFDCTPTSNCDNVGHGPQRV